MILDLLIAALVDMFTSMISSSNSKKILVAKMMISREETLASMASATYLRVPQALPTLPTSLPMSIHQHITTVPWWPVLSVRSGIPGITRMAVRLAMIFHNWLFSTMEKPSSLVLEKEVILELSRFGSSPWRCYARCRLMVLQLNVCASVMAMIGCSRLVRIVV